MNTAVNNIKFESDTDFFVAQGKGASFNSIALDNLELHISKGGKRYSVVMVIEAYLQYELGYCINFQGNLSFIDYSDNAERYDDMGRGDLIMHIIANGSLDIKPSEQSINLDMSHNIFFGAEFIDSFINYITYSEYEADYCVEHEEFDGSDQTYLAWIAKDDTYHWLDEYFTFLCENEDKQQQAIRDAIRNKALNYAS